MVMKDDLDWEITENTQELKEIQIKSYEKSYADTFNPQIVLDKK